MSMSNNTVYNECSNTTNCIISAVHPDSYNIALTIQSKPEPIILSDLPIIPSRISHNIYPLFLFYSHVITYYSLNVYCVSDNEVHSLFSS